MNEPNCLISEKIFIILCIIVYCTEVKVIMKQSVKNGVFKINLLNIFYHCFLSFLLFFKLYFYLDISENEFLSYYFVLLINNVKYFLPL